MLVCKKHQKDPETFFSRRLSWQMGLLAAHFLRIGLMTTARYAAETALLLHPAKQSQDVDLESLPGSAVYEAAGVEPRRDPNAVLSIFSTKCHPSMKWLPAVQTLCPPHPAPQQRHPASSQVGSHPVTLATCPPAGPALSAASVANSSC